MASRAPIALFAYNRADYAERALRALARCPELADSPFYIFCDGAKSAAGKAKVDAARNVVREHAPKHATIVERETNFGLARSIRTGVTELCEKYGRIIVLEDDLEVSSTFLGYMNAGLDRYAEDPRVMEIVGYMYPVEVAGPHDALFLPVTCSWGWATWARAWAKLDSGQDWYDRMLRDRELRRRFDLDDAFPYFEMLTSQRRGEIDSWAIRWNLDVFANNGLVLFPRRSLLANRGHDGTGTHAEQSSPFEASAHAFVPSSFPSEVRVDEQQARQVREFIRRASRGTLRNRVGRLVGRARAAARAWIRR
jgi:hypothetical protein